MKVTGVVGAARSSGWVPGASGWVLGASGLVLGLASFAHAQELPAGYGTSMPSRSKVTTTLGNGLDVDDYTFVGYVGQKADVSIKLPRKSATNATLVLVRPDGTEMTPEDLGTKFKLGRTFTVSEERQDPDTGEVTLEDVEVRQVLRIKATLDQLGTWKARVRIPDAVVAPGESGSYSIAVKYGKPPKTTLKSPLPTEVDTYRFRLEAEGDALLNFAFTFKGADAALVGVLAPNGEFVDVGTRVKSKAGKFVKATKVAIPTDFPRGAYELTFRTTVGATFSRSKFSASIKLAKGPKKRKGKIDGNEPAIAGLPAPAVGGPPSGGNLGTQISVNVQNAFDIHDTKGSPTLLLGSHELTDVVVDDNPGITNIRGNVPSGIADGIHDVVVRTSKGQVSVRENAFTIVPPPAADSVEPTVGSEAGGYEVTITGAGFPDSLSEIGLLVDGNPVGVNKISVTPTEFTFLAPPRVQGNVTFGVQDLRSQLADNLPLNSFRYLSTPGISRIIPGLVPILGGDQLFVKGTNFRPTDRLFIETDEGGFEEMTGTYQNANLHAFTAPVRPKGAYEVYVVDAQNVRTPGLRTVSYFQFADFTSDSGLDSPPANDLRDAWTTALSDFDDDGDEDLFLARRGDGARDSVAQVQVFVNDGNGNLTDESALRIPAPSTTDDWRADKIRVIDVTQDGYADILITTNSTQVPASNASHTRILVSRRRGPSTDVGDRVFVDQTLDLMAPPRLDPNSVSNTTGDNWRGLDMWVGDVDLGPAGPPEILITHKDLKEEIDVLCGNYCSSGVPGALYRFYWGGSRAFVWNPKARNGQGQYDFENTFFPRKSGVLVPIIGRNIPACNDSTPCRGEFTPFTGHSLAVEDIDGDRKPDVVVLNDEPVMAFGSTTSSIQVGLNVFNLTQGSLLTDMTPDIAALGGVTTGHEVAIGRFGYPDGNGFGTIVVSQQDAPSGGGFGLRLLQFVPSALEGDLGDFDDITVETLPAVNGDEAWQASAIGIADVDADGDDDLVLVADAEPGVGTPALRILRNVVEDLEVGKLRTELAGLVETVVQNTGDPFDGTSLLIGDLDGDGAAEYIVTRSVPIGSDTQTRTMTTDQ